MISASNSCHKHHHNVNSSQLINSTLPSLVYETRFTSPIAISEGAKVGILDANNSNCWCKKWSFRENEEKSFEEYLR